MAGSGDAQHIWKEIEGVSPCSEFGAGCIWGACRAVKMKGRARGRGTQREAPVFITDKGSQGPHQTAGAVSDI